MAIKYHVIQRGEPGVVGGGEKKFYATTKVAGEKTLAGLTHDIEKICTVSGADIRAVLYALVDVIQGSLADGQTVRLGELGSMRVSISSRGEKDEKAVTADSILSSKIVFTPSTEIKKMLANIKYQKA